MSPKPQKKVVKIDAKPKKEFNLLDLIPAVDILGFNCVGHDLASIDSINGGGRLPSKVERHMAHLAAKLDKTDAQLREDFNLPDEYWCQTGVLRLKYGYEYFKKFETHEYQKDNTVTDEEWLKPIDNRQEFVRIML